ncbi:MAG TPA: ADP-forming succinate--CoA ligase subunit beta [Vicinamibacterales bacterium]|nr:ADP-forming succinate--CoA ligase subunit beta [Vicinamibacterales bacterium]
MKIHEYQAKAVLSKYGVPVPRGEVAFTPEEVHDIAKRLGGPISVVKAQIHAGGRGKAGGVKLAKSSQEAETIARELLGKTLVTYQTGPDGQKVSRLLVEEGLAIDQELYLGLVLDRSSKRIVLMVSKEGGVEIEKVAEEHPEKLFKVFINPATGLQAFEAQKLAFALGLTGDSLKKGVKMMLALYNAFIATDASILEINPLIVTKSGDLLALDAKMNFDDNALYRHADIRELRDTSEEDPLEVEASKYSLNYIRLDGTIGCMVNGAGLAMATMDIIKLYGMEPANFLDVGGSATKEKVASAFKIITSDPKVKGILVNIFGGIMKCDVIAEGVVAAVKEVGLKVPLVVRLEGTNVELGKKIIKESGLNVTSGDDLDDAAQKIVAAVKKGA